MQSVSGADMWSLVGRHGCRPESVPIVRLERTLSTPAGRDLPSMDPDSGRSTMRNGAQRAFPLIRQSNRKSKSSFQCQIESYDVDSSKARIRELLVSIADKKTELEDINSQLEEAEGKTHQLVRHGRGRGRSTSRCMDRIPYYLGDGDVQWRHSDFGKMGNLPDQFFPAFEFDGESEGIFKRTRHRGWSIVERQCYSVTRTSRSRSSSSWTHTRPELTLRSSSSWSRMTDAYSSELDDVVLHDFPAPPERTSKTWHNRDYSAMSSATLMSTSTLQDEVSAVLEAKSLFLQRKTSSGPVLVQISPASALDYGLRISNQQRESPEPRHRYRYSNGSSIDGRWRYRHSGRGLANTHHAHTVKPMSNIIEASPLLNNSPAQKDKSTFQVDSPNSSQYSRDVDGWARSTNAQSEASNVQPQPSDDTPPTAFGPPKRIPPRTSSLYPNSTYVRTPKLGPYGDEIDPATGYITTKVDQVPLRLQHSLIARSTMNPPNDDFKALSTVQHSSRARRRNCLPRLCDRLLSKSVPKRKSGIQRLRARIRSMPLNPSWWKDRHSGPPRLPTPSGRLSQMGYLRSTASSPLPNLQRASSSFHFERAFTAMVQSSNVSTSNSAVMSPNRTIRAIRRESYISYAESSCSSDPGTPPSIFTTNSEREQGTSSRVSDRYHGRRHISSNYLDVPSRRPDAQVVQSYLERPVTHLNPNFLDVPLRRPDAHVVQSFLERPATHRRIPSLAELA